MQIKSEEFYGRISILSCAVLWSTSGLFIKLIDAHPMVISGARSFLAAILMVTLRIVFPQKTNVKTKTALKIKSLWAAGIAYSATMVLFVIANKMTTAANVILLQYSAPAWAALLAAILLREKLLPENKISLALVFAGLIIFFKDSLSSGNAAGSIVAVLSGICYGANAVFLRMQKSGDAAFGMMLAHFITFAVCLPFFFTDTPSIDSASIGAILFMGFIQIGMASVLFSYGIKRLSAAAALIIACIEPILSPVWVLMVTGEKPSFSAVLGGIIIISAVLFSGLGKQIFRRKESPPMQP
jgi:drug/metabolite transporter (DMT)-like permease